MAVVACHRALRRLLDLGHDLPLRPVGVLGLDQRGDSGDVRGGEAGAVVGAVAAAGDGGDHVHAGGGDADEAAALGEVRAFVVPVGGGDGEDALVRGGVGRLHVAAHAVVARRGDDHDVLGQGVVHRLLQERCGLKGVGGVLGDVDDVGLRRVGGVADGLGQGLRRSVAVGVVLLDRDDRRVGGEAGEAGALRLAGGDDAGNLGAVAHRVRGAVLLAAFELPAVGVLEVLPHQVAARLDVHGAGELGVLHVDAGVDDGHPYPLPGGLLPQFVHEDALQRPGAARVLLRRERALGRVVGSGRRDREGDQQDSGGGRRGQKTPGRRHRGARHVPAAPHEPCGWLAAPVESRGPVGRNVDQAAGTGVGSTSL
ncbi:hypothetical protein SMICM17S_02395 [Streptomyces microflavus]